ncbi:MAG: type II toxin-antitoxin system MqsA family antitoxin [Proteobacteria bacterium]|nr:type II toxin-antitoxin system MqsA family antitoxin [Pseudomonadota bacterium]MBU2619780.1 type II toxin-antitoxin system MqsA family antitoxin [Pseudomonadota bacterium]
MHDTRDPPYAYKGKATVIPSVTVDFCPACCEVVLGAADSARSGTAPLEFNKQVKTEG